MELLGAVEIMSMELKNSSGKPLLTAKNAPNLGKNIDS